MTTTVPPSATQFLMSFAQAVSGAALYAKQHPARKKAAAHLFDDLAALLADTPNPRFTFLDDEIIFGKVVIRSLRDWRLGARLSKAGIQWLEFDNTVQREDIEAFVEDACEILAAPVAVPIDPLLFQRRGICWGAVTIRNDIPVVPGVGGGNRIIADSHSFREEIETTRWISTVAREGGSIPLDEAQAIVRSLAVALHQDRDVLMPLARLGDSPDSTSHSVGVAILAMAFAEFIGMNENETRAAGIAAILHDIGLSQVPDEILAKEEALTNEEELIYQKHTEYGARILLAAERDLSLAAVVAYEHHISPDGTGYPVFRHPRETHRMSRIISICSSYHSRRSTRPFRPALDAEAVLNHIEWFAGTKYDAELAISFAGMMRDAHTRVSATQA